MRLAVIAKAVSSGGDLLAATALVLALAHRGLGGFAVAAVLIAAAAPPVLLVRWTGRLVDRVDSRLLLTVTPLAQAAICVTLAFASAPAEIIALVVLLAAGLAATGPCLSALLPAMVDAADLPKATALGQTATSIGALAAPALGGTLMGQFGLRAPLFVDAGSYLVLVVAGLTIRTQRGGPRRRAAVAAGAVAAGAVGPARTRSEHEWRLRNDALLWPSVALLGAVVLAASLVNVAGIFFITGTLRAPAGVYGLLESAWLAAAGAGGWLLARRKPSDAGLAVTVLGSLALTCAGVVLIAAARSAAWVAPAEVIGGLGNGVLNVAIGVLFGRRAPAEARGRAFAVSGAVANGATGVGLLLAGAVLEVLTPRAGIAAAGLAGLAVTAAFAVPLLRSAARERSPRRPGAVEAPPRFARPGSGAQRGSQMTSGMSRVVRR